MTKADDLLDMGQAAQFLNVSETSLRRWTNAGRLACVRVGRKRERRFRRADLLAFLEEQPADRAPQSAPPAVQYTVLGDVPLPHGSHLCGLYAGDQGAAQPAAAFLAGGLRAGSVCYLVSTSRVRGRVLGHLEQVRPSLKAEIRTGRLVMSEYAASARAQYDYFEANFVAATAGGARSLLVVGDVSGGPLAREKTIDDVIAYERGYDSLLARRFPLVTLCQYDVQRFAGREVFDVLQCHTDTFRYPMDRLFS